VPFWGFVFLVVWLIRKYVVIPRIGVVKFGPIRKAKLMKFTVVMLVFNVVALILGFLAAGSIGGQMTTIIFSLLLLTGFSIAAYFLDFRRLYIYGLLVGLSPVAGEWLYTYQNAAHHGYPITFGASAAIMILVGLAMLLRLLRENPVPPEGISSEEA
jgi:hypothetical protein